jgi:hypothetical protein
MKYLLTILILLFASTAFAGGDFGAFGGANDSSVDKEMYQEPEIIQNNPVDEQESDFKINERLYRESIGSNGYYGGGFYGEEKYASLIDYYTISSHNRGFEFGTGFIVVNDQLIQTNAISPFFSPIIRGGIIFNRGIGINLGGFSFRRR